MARKVLVDRLVVGEYREFAAEPLQYAADRARCLDRLVDEGAARDEAEAAWGKFETRYLVHDGGGLTLSAHGIDRAEALGETVYLDDSVQAEIVERLDGDGKVALDALGDRTGIGDDEMLHNLWMLRRRGVVETRTDLSGDGRSVILTGP